MLRILLRCACLPLCTLLVLAATACPDSEKSNTTRQGRATAPARDPSSGDTLVAEPQDGRTGSPAPAGDEAALSLPHKTVAVVFGASESDEWTAAMLGVLSSELGIDPLGTGSAQTGLDVFGPHEAALAGRPVTLHLALCDLSSVADLAAQQKLGELAREWIIACKPDAVWLDGDQLQLHCGSELDPALPIVFSGVEVRTDAFYDEGRAICGALRQHSLARTVAELLRELPDAKNVALVSDDSALGLSRIADVRALEAAMPYGVRFVTQEPVSSWDGLRRLLSGLDSGIDAVLVVGTGGSGGGLARAGSPPAGLLSTVKQPVFVWGPSPLDNSGVFSLRIKPAAHARRVLELLDKVLAGRGAAALGGGIPDEMELYRSER